MGITQQVAYTKFSFALKNKIKPIERKDFPRKQWLKQNETHLGSSSHNHLLNYDQKKLKKNKRKKETKIN